MIKFTIKCERDYPRERLVSLASVLRQFCLKHGRFLDKADHDIESRQNEKNAVKAIHKSAVAGHDLSVVLETYLALYH